MARPMGANRKAGGHPAPLVEKLSRMTPAQRQRALSKLPPERRDKIEKELDDYNHLSQRERQQLFDRYRNFQELPPQKQEAMRRAFRRLGAVPEDRRVILREEVQRMAGLPDADRRARFNSDEFRNKYSPQEQQLLREFNGALNAK